MSAPLVWCERTGSLLRLARRCTRRRRANCVFRLFAGDHFVLLSQDRANAALGVAEEARRPDAVKPPALALVDGGAEDVPLDGVLRLAEARAVAQHAERDVLDANGV